MRIAYCELVMQIGEILTFQVGAGFIFVIVLQEDQKVSELSLLEEAHE
jgi:hypothetical protein